MGTKYSTILSGGSVPNYADNSPADDGSETAANRVKFATIKSDLTAPLHSGITNLDAKLLEQFDEGPVEISSNYTTTVSDYAKFLECDGTFTLSLLAVAGQGGYKVRAKNVGTGTVTVNVDGAGTIDGDSSIELAIGDVYQFRVNYGATEYVKEYGLLGAPLSYGAIYGVLTAEDLI